MINEEVAIKAHCKLECLKIAAKRAEIHVAENSLDVLLVQEYADKLYRYITKDLFIDEQK